MGESGEEYPPEWIAGHLSDDPVIAEDISARILNMKNVGLPSRGMRGMKRSQRKEASIEGGGEVLEAPSSRAITVIFPDATPIMLLAVLALSVLLLLGLAGSGLLDEAVASRL
ncbi:hypothetical protein [Mesorhizobium sp.]|uniref:hypothetical protein n=1 Tax=Mesorhizobium sp. TaxID=1871066 RepID=UPI000FE854F3|nr:hypothetical protein [Mesorhizobium sp.]RWK58899.1 MAG: hypothetical protein EOR49_29305 [Mesorhizobium sp.]RWM39779.1 MAG: hypothetical protein EOR76_36415 [Mesorhizobium sp.]RWM46371.1 MAG: hypothetical protein EOR78_32875 [Mesorhizobium sp.]RWM54567.1 MAG: hypothetical protein EOR79_23810 [Mesorhizobium sp.]RWM89822.1 MAG: hypothetical protein EOR85_32150 [Mesorhizobium sp.]